jgi:hypothetical protein
MSGPDRGVECSPSCRLCNAPLACRRDRRALLDLAPSCSNAQLAAHTVGLPLFSPRSVLLFQPQGSIASIRLTIRLLTGYELNSSRSNERWFTVLGPYVHPELAGARAETSSTLVSCLSALRSDRSLFVVANDVSKKKLVPWRRLLTAAGMDPSVTVMRMSLRAPAGRVRFSARIDTM